MELVNIFGHGHMLSVTKHLEAKFLSDPGTKVSDEGPVDSFV